MKHDKFCPQAALFASELFPCLPTASMEASRRWYDLYHAARGGEQA